ncbi:uncharacterized protein BHQ10_008967 [Talaromyces amestolkiae]|uniref:Cadmium resistance transporter n=1 Tax=Talaromyces amestolkiae TaxID=1196081 RepID=A0A364LAU9_TALAM|nr:uncharacterized protein BHQ10_008967 [Talaromyces amestolkiae]RAO72955.1 hypothetical protein BHQ10_008967 [Talaromyces amestolkiae]
MQFGKAVGTACSSFAITNIDDMFVLAAFFAESYTSESLTPLKITIGQYIGFTIIVAISMIGFGIAQALPSEPIGFLGLLPMLLGIWKLFELYFDDESEDDDEEREVGAVTEKSHIATVKSILKVSIVTVTNGGDNIGTYVPLFSQAQGAEIAVYIVTYYILLGVWCLVAYLIMRQKHILRLGQKYAGIVVPFLFIGLGIYIIVKSSCYPWSIEHINDSLSSHIGETVMAVVTTGLLLICIGAMFWLKLRKKNTQPTSAISGAEHEVEAPNDDTTAQRTTEADAEQSVATTLVEPNIVPRRIESEPC